jgi:hypothetical protein
MVTYLEVVFYYYYYYHHHHYYYLDVTEAYEIQESMVRGQKEVSALGL